jgi:dephospho-CoA kinase
VLVIDCPVATQIKRVQKRDNLSLERVQSIIDSQVSRTFRLAHAQDVIDNTQSNAELAQQVEKLHNLYLSLSSY